MVRAIDLIERVTTSIWPGTTISLLKFPVWNPTPYKLEQRRQRLITEQKWKWKVSSFFFFIILKLNFFLLGKISFRRFI